MRRRGRFRRRGRGVVRRVFGRAGRRRFSSRRRGGGRRRGSAGRLRIGFRM